MLYEFRSRATGPVVMVGKTGEQILQIIGKPVEPTGIITVAQIPAAIAALKQAAEREQAPADDDQDDNERNELHHRTGDQWCIYPTYDWAHGQSDAIEGVTHSICTLEFETHRPLYDWFLAQLDLPAAPPRQYEFARLELTHTVTSKRRLKKLVDDGVVDGWDDPRMPTIRGLRRRGYPAAALRAFCREVGTTRTNSRKAIEELESYVRRELNATAQRRMAVLRPLRLVLEGWPTEADGTPVTEWFEVANNPENEADGTRKVPFTGELWILS